MIDPVQDDTSETEYPVMPDLASSYFHFRHTLHSALEVLARFGVSGPRITIRMAGLGWRPDWIVGQAPRPGTLLRPHVPIELSVAGLGFFHNLPVGMWDRGGEGEIGTQEIVELFDDPLQKARHWIREGARVFDIHPDNPVACARWIALFGIDSAEWPESMLYELALLVPELHRRAGTEEGIRHALNRLLDLDLLEIRLKPAFLALDAEAQSSLGRRSSELGLDFVLGDRIETRRLWDLHVGPVTIDRYQTMQESENQRLLQQTLRLTMPCEQAYKISWLVLDPERAPRLGVREENACLGINFWLGPTDFEETSQRAVGEEEEWAAVAGDSGMSVGVVDED